MPAPSPAATPLSSPPEGCKKLFVLGVETSTPHAEVAISDGDRLLASARLGRGRAHAEFVMPAIDFVLSEAGVSIGEVELIACGLGPGLFTGMRVGIATARSIAMVLSRPAIGVASLATLAESAVALAGPAGLAAVIDARRGEVFWSLFGGPADVLPRPDAIRIGSPEECVAELSDAGRVLIVGDALAAYPDAFGALDSAVIAGPDLSHPNAAALNRVAYRSYEPGIGSERNVASTEPIYVRKSDAEINWSTAEREAAAISGGSG